MERYGEIIHGHYGEYLTSRYGDAPEYIERDYFLHNIAIGDNDKCNQILILGTFGSVDYIWSTYCGKQENSGVSMGYQHVVYCHSDLNALHDVGKIINFSFADEERCRHYLLYPDQFKVSGSLQTEYGSREKAIHIDRSLLSQLASYCIYKKSIRAKKYLYILVPDDVTNYQEYCRCIIELLLSVIPDGLRSNLCIATNASEECEKDYDILFIRERGKTIPCSIRVDQEFDQTFLNSRYWDKNIQGMIQQCTCDAKYLQLCNDYMKGLFAHSAIPSENDYSFYFEIEKLRKEEDAFSKIKKSSELLGQKLEGWKYNELDNLIKTWGYTILSFENIIRQEKESERWYHIEDMINILTQCENFIVYLRKRGYGYLPKRLLMEELRHFSFSDKYNKKTDLYNSITIHKELLKQYFSEQDVQSALEWAENQKNSIQYEQKIADIRKNPTKNIYQAAYEFANKFCPDGMERLLEETEKILLTEYKKRDRNEDDILQIIEAMENHWGWEKISPELRMFYYKYQTGRKKPDPSIINDISKYREALSKRNNQTNETRKELDKIDKWLLKQIKSIIGSDFWSGKDTFEVCLWELKKWYRFINIKNREEIPLLKEFENNVSRWPIRRRSFWAFCSAISVLEEESNDVLEFYYKLWKWLSIRQKLGIVITSSSTPSEIYSEILCYSKLPQAQQAYFYNDSSIDRNLGKTLKDKIKYSNFDYECLNINDSRICLRMCIFKEKEIPLSIEDMEFLKHNWDRCEPCFNFFYLCGFLSKETLYYFKNNLVDAHEEKDYNTEHLPIMNDWFQKAIIAMVFTILLVSVGCIYFPRIIRKKNRIMIPSSAAITESVLDGMESSESSIDISIESGEADTDISETTESVLDRIESSESAIDISGESSEANTDISETNVETITDNINDNNSENVTEQLIRSSELWANGGLYLDACNVLDNVFNRAFDWQIMSDVEASENAEGIKQTIREYLALQVYQEYLLTNETKNITLSNVDYYMPVNDKDSDITVISDYPVMLMKLEIDEKEKYLIYCYDEDQKWYINYWDTQKDSFADETNYDLIINQQIIALKHNNNGLISPTKTKNIKAAFDQINRH